MKVGRSGQLGRGREGDLVEGKKKRGGRANRNHDWIGEGKQQYVGRVIREPLSANDRLEEERPVDEAAEWMTAGLAFLSSSLPLSG